MAYTTTTSLTATPTPMTTPFAIPGTCTGNFNFATTVVETRGSNTYTFVDLLDIGPDSDACNHGQAPNSTIGDLGLRFSPGVCPSAWTAYGLHIETRYYEGKANARKSSAVCCPSGFTPFGGYHDGIDGCLQTTATSTTTSDASSSSDPYDDPYHHTSTQRFETAWYITWAKSDTKTMTPRPPSLGDKCTNAEIATWVPGAKVPDADRSCQREESGGFLGSSIFWFLAVGLPIIFVGTPIICLCCVRPAMKDRRRKRRQEHYEAQARAASAVVVGTGGTEN